MKQRQNMEGHKSPSKLGILLKRERSKVLFICTFLVPILLFYFICDVVPIFSSFFSSFHKWSGFGNMEYIGWKNYVNVLKDPVFFQAIKNDLIYVLGKEILIVPITVLFAVALTRLHLKKTEKNVYRYLFYIPNILSVSITGIMWAFIYDPYNGLLNGFLKLIGLERLIPADGWLVDYTMPSIIMVATWCGIGYFMIVMISAINSISGEIYEAAQVDGAGEWAQLWNITLPAVWEQLRFVIVQIIIGTLGNYSLAMILANGGVNGSGMVMGLYVYQYGLSSATPKVGYANAAAVLLMIISSSLVLITNRLLNKEEV